MKQTSKQVFVNIVQTERQCNTRVGCEPTLCAQMATGLAGPRPAGRLFPATRWTGQTCRRLTELKPGGRLPAPAFLLDALRQRNHNILAPGRRRNLNA